MIFASFIFKKKKINTYYARNMRTKKKKAKISSWHFICACKNEKKAMKHLIWACSCYMVEYLSRAHKCSWMNFGWGLFSIHFMPGTTYIKHFCGTSLHMTNSFHTKLIVFMQKIIQRDGTFIHISCLNICLYTICL